GSAATRPQAADPFERVDVIVKGRSDKCLDADIELVGSRPVVEPMNQLLEARERELAALPGFRHKAISADVRARGMPQRKCQSSGDNLPGHAQFLPLAKGRSSKDVLRLFLGACSVKGEAA